MKPYYEQDGITIYHGDALEILPSIEPQSVDIVATDPPYLLGGASTRRGERAQSPVADWVNASRWYRDWLGAAFAACKPCSPVWMFGNWRTLPVVEIAVQAMARRITSTLVWDKQWIGVGSMNGLRCQYELVLLMGGPEFSIKDRSIGDIWQEKWSSSRPNGHTQEKPVGLIERLLSVSGAEGGCVLDPFMGSGTTGEACIRAGRKFIGIELDERWCEHAANRLRQGVLFGIAEATA